MKKLAYPTSDLNTNLRYRGQEGRFLWMRERQAARPSERANVIHDEFTDLPISRQRKYQLRHKKKGLCIQCSRPTPAGVTQCDDCYLRIRQKNNAGRRNLGAKRFSTAPEKST